MIGGAEVSMDEKLPTTEPDWEMLRQRMDAMTMRQLKPVKAWFCGCLGGVSGKAAVINEMVGQMEHWWRRAQSKTCDAADRQALLTRLGKILREIDDAEGGQQCLRF